MVHLHVKMSSYGHAQKRESVSEKNTEKTLAISQTRMRAIVLTCKSTNTVSLKRASLTGYRADTFYPKSCNLQP